MTCKELGGACNQEFEAETFEEIAQKSRRHGMEMMQSGDSAHIRAMESNARSYEKSGSHEQVDGRHKGKI